MQVDVDYLVIGAGATAMAFTDALLDHADVRVAIVDRRHAPGGHWLAAYPFVRLHQASAFYGVASTLLGGGRIQEHGPERGLQERADQPSICAYYAAVLELRVAAGRAEFFGGCDYLGDRTFRSRVHGRTFTVPDRCRIVDARYLAPLVPSEMPRRFPVAPFARVVPVNELVRVEDAPRQYVVLGAGKTATDACVWLLQRGVDPDAICWVRPREPWMLDRAVVQPDPAVFLGMGATVFEQAARSSSLEEFFSGLEEAGVLLRVDRAVQPTMARVPTLGRWELDLLRSIENVVRLGHVTAVREGRLELTRGAASIARDALVVDCTAEGLRTPPLVPVWRPEVITPQPIRAGFPCFGAALVGYVEATRTDDAQKNAACRPSPYGNSLIDWVRMNLIGARNAHAFAAEPDIAAWAQTLALNPAGTLAAPSTAADAARARLASAFGPGLEALERLAR